MAPKLPFTDKDILPTLNNVLLGFMSYWSNDISRTTTLQDTIKQKHMLTKDAISRFCVELIHLYMFSMLGEYEHGKKKITKDIRNSITNCKGSWFESLAKINSCYWFGYSVTEPRVSVNKFNRIVLEELKTLDPTLYEFVGKDGQIDKVYYRVGKGYQIDYDKVLHLVTGDHLNFDVLYGTGRCEPAMPYWELHLLMMPVLAVAGQRQATPILVKKTDTGANIELVDPDTGEVVKDTNGEPVIIKGGWDAVQQLSQLSNSGVTAIDHEDDLYQIEPKIAADFLLNLVKLGEQYRMLSFLVPSTVGSFSSSGIGDAGLAQTHLTVFEQMTASMLQFLINNLIDSLFRPIIIYNHGEQSDYGKFPINTKDPKALEIAKIAIDAVNKGTFTRTDVKVINKIRQSLGIDSLDESLFDGLPVISQDPSLVSSGSTT